MEKIDINLTHGGYSLYIGKNLIKNIGESLKEYEDKKIVIITDNNVYGIYNDKLSKGLKDFNIQWIVLDPGEESKTLGTAQYIYNQLIDYNITRMDLIIAFGGGVVGDIAGFVASTYLRGIKFIQIPTTLLAQVDSSVGGKVGVNLSKGKNLVGSFYHPKAVLIDPGLLQTLDRRVFNDGMAEVIKYGCIKDNNLFKKLLNFTHEELIEGLEGIIYTCCNIKRIVVEKDERDTGERMLLNFGHTLGHGIEKYFGYEEYTHGEGVAVGMYNITIASEKLGITQMGTSERIKEALIKYNLPYKMPNIEKERLIDIVGLDKKGEGDRINIVLLRKIGESFINNISFDDLAKLYIGW